MVACLRNSRDSVKVVTAVGVHAWTLLMQTLEGLYPMSDVPLWQHLHFILLSAGVLSKNMYALMGNSYFHLALASLHVLQTQRMRLHVKLANNLTT